MLLEKIYTAYAPENDITFIMKDTYDENGEPDKTTVVGWHYGEPHPDITPRFIGDLVAEY